MQLYNLNKKQSSGRSGGGEGGSGGGGNDEDDEIDGPAKSTPEEESGDGCETGGKGMSLFRFGSAKKKLLLLQRRRRRKGSLANSRRSGRGGGVGGGVGCCLCIKQPMTLDSSAESPTSDPNSEDFTNDMLRVFIEKNDFYARECNPHLDDK